MISNRTLRGLSFFKLRSRCVWKYLVVSIVYLTAFYALPVAAAEIVSNLGEFPDKFYSANASKAQAQGFVTGSGSDTYLLTSVTVDITGTVLHGSGFFVVRIFSDNNGKPGNIVPNGLLVGPTQPSLGLNTYGASDNIVLASNATYWVTAQVINGTGDYGLSFTNSLSQTGAWTILDHSAYSNDSGATWSTVDATAIMRMSVSASAPQPVPTLSEWGFIILCLLMTGAAFWHLKRKMMI